MLWLVILAVSMWILQLVLGLWQFKRFNRSLKELRKQGRVAIGKAKGKFAQGVVVLLCIDENANVIAGRKMQGRTVFATPKPFDAITGLSLSKITEKDCLTLDKKTRKAVLDAVENYKSFIKEAAAEKQNGLSAG